MQPILAHTKTIRSKRVKLHRKLAEVLEDELGRRGTACVIAEEIFGKWKGLQETVIDQEIVWPPMVIIQNTLLEHDENEQVCYLSFRSICSIHIYNGVDAFGMSWKSCGYWQTKLALKPLRHFVEA
jgi:hypothetical protein